MIGGILSLIVSSLIVPAHADLNLQIKLLKQYRHGIVRVVKPSNTENGGTGFHVQTSRGRVFLMTNEHVCNEAEKGYMVAVLRSTGNVNIGVKTKVRKADKRKDLCILDPVIRFGSPIKMGVRAVINEIVTGFGYPYLLPLAPLQGILLEQEDPSHIYTSARAYPGNSGSPVMNNAGELVGVVEAIYPPTNAAKVIPIHVVRDFIKEY